ncbi:MAG TPA: methyltransferase domain-containing protein [Thermoleophilaceae bacterium]|nr:methyltransferase domain-containing protein [Thermoleophilaceae bacterium]
MPTGDAATRVREMSWYHTIDLGDGLVTDGWFDNRPHVHHYGLPERMDGMRVLDIGTWDGFWAFEMERRGAEVVALDVEHESEYDWPPRRRPAQFADLQRGDGFRLIKEITGSQVERVHCNIYEATPEKLGTFDLVFCGVVLVHLRDQLLALERFANLCHGQLILAEEYDRLTSLLPIPVARYHADREAAVVFWLPSRQTWKRMTHTAGFDDVREHGRFRQTIASAGGKELSIPHVVLHAKGRAPVTEPPDRLG